MSFSRVLLIIACAALLPTTPLAAQDITSGFNTGEGFTTGSFAPVTLSSTTAPGFGVTFSGGQQQQIFDMGSYANGPAAYLFINGVFQGSFFGETASGDGINDDTGLIDFFGFGASQVAFSGANRGFGAGVDFDVFALDDTTLLSSGTITDTVNSSAASNVVLTAAPGTAIGSIVFDLPGPANNGPYVLAIDNFSATQAVPEPSSAAIFMIGMFAMASRRRRS